MKYTLLPSVQYKAIQQGSYLPFKFSTSNIYFFLTATIGKQFIQRPSKVNLTPAPYYLFQKADFYFMQDNS